MNENLTPVSPKVAELSPVITQHLIQWNTVDVLMAGTTAMRAAGARFLKKEADEGTKEYGNRLARTFLNPFYKQAVSQAVAKVFAKDVQFENAPPQLSILATDIDGQQRNMSRFAMQVFHDAVHHGISYLLVDMPHVATPFANAAQEVNSGIRPYWVSIPSDKVVKLHSEMVNGVEKLILFSYREDALELSEDGYEQKSYQQIREYRHLMDPVTKQLGQVQFTIYRKTDNGWVVKQRDVMRQKKAAIPIVPVYANQTGFYTGSPVFTELADLSIQHWNKTSDLENILHIANVPFLFGKSLKAGTDEKGGQAEVKVSIHRALIAKNSDADIKWVEHTGSTIATALQDIERLEIRMKEIGNNLLMEASTNVTATQSSINAADANSQLKNMAMNLQDALTIAMVFTADLLGLSSYGEVRVNTSFAEDKVATETFADVKQLYTDGIIDRDAYLAEAKRRGIVSLDTEIAEEEEIPEPELTAEVNSNVAPEDGESDITGEEVNDIQD